MKSFIVLVVVCCAIGLSESHTKEERQEMFAKMVKECATKEGASSAEVDEIMAHKPTTTRGGKCLKACLMETLEIIKNNQVNPDGFVKMVTMAYDGDAAKESIARDIANACAGTTDEDRCEAAAKICDCGRDAAKDRGLSFDNL